MEHHQHTPSLSLAMSATLHCLTGCAIGEISGLVIGTLFNFTNLLTIIISVTLAFLFGYSLSLMPLMKARISFASAAKTVLAADTLSITVMELVDNGVMAFVPGAMGGGLVNPLFWVTMVIALVIAFIAALPVNYYLLQRGKGHALTHRHM